MSPHKQYKTLDKKSNKSERVFYKASFDFLPKYIIHYTHYI